MPEGQGTEQSLGLLIESLAGERPGSCLSLPKGLKVCV